MIVGQLIADRYELLELVGTGGMSSVFRARDRLLERDVALKVLHEQYSRDESYVERFRREARAVAQLSHPNIVTVIDRGEEDGRQFIVFEYIDGENLKDVVRRDAPLGVRDALELGIQVARALAFAHHQGLVHRDVKPQNVLVNGDGRAKVTDFGIARSVEVKGLTQTGTVLGTSEYIAPEQARGGTVEPQTDVYSLAVVLYELLTGDVPFAGDNFVAVAMRHVNEPAPSVAERRPDVPLRLDAALRRAMEKDPRDRFASMDEFVAELEACLAQLGPEGDADATIILPAGPAPAKRPRAPRRAAGGRRRWPLVVAVLVVLAAAAAAATVVLTHESGSGGSGATTGGGGGGGGGGGTVAVSLTGLRGYDPSAQGDGHEHDEAASRATDGNEGTYWYTEHYNHADVSYKGGVGLILDAGSAKAVSRLVVTTDTPGYTASIQAGDSTGGGFREVSGSQRVDGRTTFDLASGTRARYYVIWITDLGGHQSVHVNEVTARS